MDPFEFTLANLRRITTIKEAIETRVDNDMSVRVHVSEGRIGTISQGVLGPDFFLGGDPTLSDSEAQQQADRHNDVNIALALGRVIDLRGSACMYATAVHDYTTDQALEAFREAGLDTSGSFLDTNEATVDLAATQLETTGSFDEVAETHYTFNDGLVVEAVKIFSVAGKPVNVGYLVRPVEDELFERANQAGIAHHFVRLMGVQDEEILDQAISQIWLELQGTHLEESIGPLLDEIRGRILAENDSTQLSVQHGLQYPTTDKLDEIAERIA